MANAVAMVPISMEARVMHTEFQRVAQRQAYESCANAAVVKFTDDFAAAAYNAGFRGLADIYDHKGLWYAYWCAGRDRRDNMRKAA